MSRHKLRITKWENGVMHRIEELYESFEEALKATRRHNGHIKIYDHSDSIVHSQVNSEIEDTNESYA